MDWKRVGIYLIVASAIFAFSNLAITGAVVGAGQVVGSWSMIAMVSFVLGIFLFMASPGLETIVDEDGVNSSGVVSKEKIFKMYEKNFTYTEPTVVIDTSFLISFYNDRKVMLDYLNAHADVVVPGEVLDEFSGEKQGHIQEFLRKNTNRPEESYKKHMNHARDVLNMGEKAYLYEIVEGILSGEDEVPLEGSEDHKEYALGIDKLKTALMQQGVELTNDNLRAEAKRHWAVSEADAAVLAIAMDYQSRGEKSLIMEKDKDFEEAVKYVRRVDESKDISYLNAYGKTS